MTSSCPSRRIALCCGTILLVSSTILIVGSFRTAQAGDESDSNKTTNQAVTTVEFVYEEAAFPSCHASTVALSQGHPVAAWFGGTDEGNKDVGIWFARRVDGTWSAPVEVANGVQTEGQRHPCWNPVLFSVQDGPLLLFYKVGPNPRSWWGMIIISRDGGKTWGEPSRLPDGAIGPIKNKPVMLAGQRLLSGASTEDNGWRVHMEWTDDRGTTISHTPPLNDGKSFGAIQPTILVHGQDRVQILCRSKGLSKIVESWSSDRGETWTPLKPIDLPNPNSGIDAVTLEDGRHLLVYNHTTRGRSPLNVAISPDGKKWFAVAVLEQEPGEYSYPAIIQAPDGKVHITYTWRRKRIRHVVLDPTRFEPREIVAGQWPE